MPFDPKAAGIAGIITIIATVFRAWQLDDSQVVNSRVLPDAHLINLATTAYTTDLTTRRSCDMFRLPEMPAPLPCQAIFLDWFLFALLAFFLLPASGPKLLGQFGRSFLGLPKLLNIVLWLALDPSPAAAILLALLDEVFGKFEAEMFPIASGPAYVDFGSQTTTDVDDDDDDLNQRLIDQEADIATLMMSLQAAESENRILKQKLRDAHAEMAQQTQCLSTTRVQAACYVWFCVFLLSSFSFFVQLTTRALSTLTRRLVAASTRREGSYSLVADVSAQLARQSSFGSVRVVPPRPQAQSRLQLQQQLPQTARINAATNRSRPLASPTPAPAPAAPSSAAAAAAPVPAPAPAAPPAAAAAAPTPTPAPAAALSAAAAAAPLGPPPPPPSSVPAAAPSRRQPAPYVIPVEFYQCERVGCTAPKVDGRTVCAAHLPKRKKEVGPDVVRNYY